MAHHAPPTHTPGESVDILHAFNSTQSPETRSFKIVSRYPPGFRPGKEKEHFGQVFNNSVTDASQKSYIYTLERDDHRIHLSQDELAEVLR